METKKTLPPLKIRERERRGYLKEAGAYTVWTEIQVVEGRRVIGRFDLVEQAQRCIDTLLKARGEAK